VTIKVSRHINQSQVKVWNTLSDLAHHPSWMKDAVNLEFTTDQTSGVGTLMEVETKIGPFATVDMLEVTDWVDGHHIVVQHRGVVTGTGRLAALGDDDGTLVTWTETLHFPWWLGGSVSSWAAKPVLIATWRGNLRRLESFLSSP